MYSSIHFSGNSFNAWCEGRPIRNTYKYCKEFIADDLVDDLESIPYEYRCNWLMDDFYSLALSAFFSKYEDKYIYGIGILNDSGTCVFMMQFWFSSLNIKEVSFMISYNVLDESTKAEVVEFLERNVCQHFRWRPYLDIEVHEGIITDNSNNHYSEEFDRLLNKKAESLYNINYGIRKG